MHSAFKNWKRKIEEEQIVIYGPVKFIQQRIALFNSKVEEERK